MGFKEAILSSYKLGLKVSVFAIPVFVPLTLVAIRPYWPANILGWLTIVSFVVFFEVFYLAFQRYVENLRNEPGHFSLTRTLKVLGVAIPSTLVLIVLLMKSLDYAKDHLFLVR